MLNFLCTSTSKFLTGSAAAIALSLPSAHAVIIASYADGTNSLANQASVTGVSPSAIFQNGVQSGAIGSLLLDDASDSSTVSGSFPTPAGPTAGTATGSPWLGTVAPALPGGLPVADNDYIGFTVNAGAGFEFDLNTISFDMAAFNGGSTNTDFNFLASVFASVDGGTTFTEIGVAQSLNQDGSTGYTTPLSVNRNFGLLSPQFENLTSVEIRIGLKADDPNAPGVSAVSEGDKLVFLQGIQLDATVRDLNAVPEPSSAALLALGALGFAGRRRRN